MKNNSTLEGRLDHANNVIKHNELDVNMLISETNKLYLPTQESILYLK